MNKIKIICESEDKSHFLCLNEKSNYCIADENHSIIFTTDIKGSNDYLVSISENGNSFSVFNTNNKKLSIYNSETGTEIASVEELDLYSYKFIKNNSLLLIEYKNINSYVLNVFDIEEKQCREIFQLNNADIGDFNFYNDELFVVYKNIDTQEFNLLKFTYNGQIIDDISLGKLMSKKVIPFSISFDDKCEKILFAENKYFLRKSNIMLADLTNMTTKKLLSIPFKNIKPMPLTLSLSCLSDNCFSVAYDDELFIYDIHTAKLLRKENTA